MHTTHTRKYTIIHNSDWSGTASLVLNGQHTIEVDGSEFLELCQRVAHQFVERALAEILERTTQKG